MFNMKIRVQEALKSSWLDQGALSNNKRFGQFLGNGSVRKLFFIFWGKAEKIIGVII